MPAEQPAQDRARCIRVELGRLLREAETGRVCLLANADDILKLAGELAEVENSLYTEVLKAKTGLTQLTQERISPSASG